MSAAADLPKATRDATGTYTARWGTVRDRYAALFRLAGMVAILQHIRWVKLRQRGPTRSDLNPAARLAKVPDRELETLRNRGYKPTEGNR